MLISANRWKNNTNVLAIQITPQMRILLATQAADFRKGIDGLSRLCRKVMGADPFSEYVFVFRNRRKTAIKISMYDGQGFWLCQKRLPKGRFRWWPKKGGDRLSRLAAYQLNLLLWNGNPAEAHAGPVWKKIQTSK